MPAASVILDMEVCFIPYCLISGNPASSICNRICSLSSSEKTLIGISAPLVNTFLFRSHCMLVVSNTFVKHKKDTSSERRSVTSVYSVFFSGSCANIIAIKIRPQPRSSFAPRLCFRMIQPASTEKTDSRLNSMDATVGFMPFCPTICRV